jgi:glycosyltransferase involved in cell wall biosynthesis
MRVLLLTDEYPPYIFGGIGTFSYNLATALSEKGVSVVVMAGCPAEAVKKGFHKAHESVNSNLELIRLTRTDLPPSQFWYEIMNMNKILSNLSDFDIVHAQYGASFPLIYCSKKAKQRVPWAVTVHTSPVSELQYAMKSVASLESSIKEFLFHVMGFPLWDFSMRVQIKLADALVPVSEDVSRVITGHYGVEPGRVSKINTGVNVAELEKFARSAASAEPRSSGRAIRMFYGGRLVWRKGILHLIKSLSYLTLKFGFDAYELEIFGQGPLTERVSSLISEYHLGRKVVLRGFVTYSELMRAMATSDIVCVPSLYEACPVGMIEAMAMSKPVVTFDRPFSRELLDGVPNAAIAKGVIDYAALLHILCTSNDLRTKFGRCLQVQAARKFDMKVIAEQYIGLYKRLMS